MALSIQKILKNSIFCTKIEVLLLSPKKEVNYHPKSYIFVFFFQDFCILIQNRILETGMVNIYQVSQESQRSNPGLNA